MFGEQKEGASEDGVVSLRRAQRWALINSTVTVALIVWNYAAGTGLIVEPSVAEISDRYQTAFTPADYAFGIWGLIFVMQLVFCAHQVKRAFRDGPARPERAAYVLRMGPWYLTAQLACGVWLIAWLSQAMFASVAIMVVLFAALMTLIVRLDLERGNAPWGVISCVWWPLSIYAGWVSVALLANISAWLYSLGAEWTQQSAWAIALALLLSGFHLFMIFSRNMREFSAVAVWALLAITVRHMQDPNPNWTIAQATLALSIVLLLAATYHAQKNFTVPPPDAFMR